MYPLLRNSRFITGDTSWGPLFLSSSLVIWHDPSYTTGITAKIPVADFTRANTEFLSNTSTSLRSTGGDVCVWIWANAKVLSDNMGILSKFRSAAGERDYLIWFFAAGNRFRVNVANLGAVNADTLGIPSTDTWYFIIAWNNDSAGTVSININDTGTDSAGNGGGPDSATTEAFRIGKFGDALTEFDGQTSAAGIMFRVPTSAEITWLYNSGTPRRYSELTDGGTGQGIKNDLVSWWELEEKSGTRMDSHGTNHLTDNNTVESIQGTLNAVSFDVDGLLSLEADRSSNGDDVSQLTDFNMPLWDVNGLNNQYAEVYDGGDYLQGAFVSGGILNQPFTIAVTYNCTTWNTGAYLFDGDDATNSVAVYETGGNIILDAGGTTRIIESTANMLGTHVLICVLDGANSKVYLDGGTSKISASAGSNSIDGITWGADQAGTNNLTITLGEKLIWNHTAQINQTGKYLADKIGTGWTNIS